MIAVIAARLVDFARRRAAFVVLGVALLAAAAAYYAAGHLALDTDVEHMLPSDLPWRQQERAFDRAKPRYFSSSSHSARSSPSRAAATRASSPSGGRGAGALTALAARNRAERTGFGPPRGAGLSSRRTICSEM